MSLYDYLQILRQRWPVVVAATLAGLLLAASVIVLTPVRYSATTRLLFGFDTQAQTGQVTRTLEYATEMVQNYSRIATLPVVLDPVIDELHLNTDAATLASRVKATSKLDSLLMEISVTNSDPQLAATIANSVARHLLKTVDVLGSANKPGLVLSGASVNAAVVTSSPDRPRLTGQVVSRAEPPVNPVWPKPGLTIGIGLVLGLALGIITAVALAVLDTRIIGRAEVAQVTPLPVIGSLPQSGRRGVFGRFLRGNVGGRGGGDRYHELAANFQALAARGGGRTISLASAYNDAASATAAREVGRFLARSGNQVLLIDADLRAPKLTAPGGSSSGLNEVLVGRANWREVIQQADPTGPYLMTTGGAAFTPDVLASPTTSQMLAEVSANFDIVLVNSAPVLGTADGLVISALTDAVMVVADESAMSREVLVGVLGSLDAVGANPIGVILHD